MPQKSIVYIKSLTLLCFGWAFLIIWRISKCAFSLSKKTSNMASSFEKSRCFILPHVSFCPGLPYIEKKKGRFRYFYHGLSWGCWSTQSTPPKSATDILSVQLTWNKTLSIGWESRAGRSVRGGRKVSDFTCPSEIRCFYPNDQQHQNLIEPIIEERMNFEPTLSVIFHASNYVF